MLKNQSQFLGYPFQIFKRGLLTNLKKRGQIFCLSPFEILKKVYLQDLQNPGPIFFSNI